MTSISKSVTEQLRSADYIFIKQFRVHHSTIDIAQSLGAVLDMPTMLDRSDIPTVQLLKPQRELQAPRDGYSRAFGYGEFPFHTDLAHWVRPPPYFMLRCHKGSPSVSTQLLQFSDIECKLGSELIARALMRPRKLRPNGTNCLLPVKYKINDLYAFRWDSLFLIPMTQAAKRIGSNMSTTNWSRIHSLSLVDPGDTLIVDNRRLLHSRTSVSPNDADRRIERVYFSEIYA